MSNQSQPPPKKARVPNFTKIERGLLLELVYKHKDAIENKKTDATTNQIKNKTWEALAEEFNSMSSDCTRSAAHLKCCWDNLKKKFKKGPPPGLFGIETSMLQVPSPPPITESLVETIISPAGNHSDDFDSDMKPEYESISNSMSELDPSTQGPVASTSSLSEFDPWSSWTFQHLQTPYNPTRPNRNQDWAKRRRPQKASYAPAAAALVKEKIRLVKIMQQAAVKESRIRLAILEEQLIQEKLKSDRLRKHT